MGEGVQVVGWPLYRLLGGAARAIPAYAGGVSLGYQEPPALVEEDSWTPTPGTVADVRRVMPGLEANGVGWLEEPFPAHDHRSYAQAATLGRMPLAAGENHYTRFEFSRVIEDPARPLEDRWRH